MKTLLLVTYVDFWRKGSGHRSRIISLVNYLKEKTQITVFFAGVENEDDKLLLNDEFSGISFEFAGSKTITALTYKEYKDKFRDFIKGKFFHFALIEYIELSIVLEFLPESTITILDTHDIIFKRIKSFRKFNLAYDGIVLSKQEELNIYQCFNYIILIQRTDFKIIAKDINPRRLLLVPHPAVFKRKNIRRKAKNVGYVASSYNPNVDALRWFIDDVWDTIYENYNLTLNIYGNIKYNFSSIRDYENWNIVFHGFTRDLEEAYDTMDIVVNPIRCGAGLKIKNVEALGYGLPLITSTHGASGMEDGASKAFLIANSTSQYLLAFDTLVKRFDLRKQLAENAFEYAQSNFSIEKCYGDLLKVIT